MSRILLSVVAGLLLGLLLVSQAGCLIAAAAVGTGATVAYVRGDLETSVAAEPQQVADATERAFKDLSIAVIEKSASGVDGKIVGRTARDVKLTVVIKGETEKLSKVSVRAGTFGDGELQQRVLDKIKEQLPATASAAAARPTSQPAVAKLGSN